MGLSLTGGHGLKNWGAITGGRLISGGYNWGEAYKWGAITGGEAYKWGAITGGAYNWGL